MNGRSVEFEDLMRVLTKAHIGFRADFRGENTYGDGTNASRTGLFLNQKHVCNIDRGTIPEFDRFNEPVPVLREVDPEWALSHPHEAITQQILLDESRPFMLKEVSDKMGKQTRAKVYFGGSAVMAERGLGLNSQGGEVQVILIRRYLRWEEEPSNLERIGWRTIIRKIGALGLPGITEHSLAKDLDRDITFSPYDWKGDPVEQAV